MAVICPACSSSLTQTLIDKNQCLACGRTFDFAGNVDSANVQFVVGNFADLQRIGGANAPKDSEPAFELPTGVTADQVYDAESDGTPREAKDAAKAADSDKAAPAPKAHAKAHGDSVTTTKSSSKS